MLRHPGRDAERGAGEQHRHPLMFPHDQLASIWQQVSTSIRTSISPDAWGRWFSRVILTEATPDTISLEVPDSMHQLWIEQNYLGVVKDAFGAFTGCRPKIVITVMPEARLDAELAGVALPPQLTGTSLGKQNTAPPLPSLEVLATLDPVTIRVASEGLSPEMTFSNYVVGKSNDYANAAALACVDKPGRAFNPLFLYGGSGLGKTHLMQAIGNSILTKRPKTKVIYVTSEEFTNQFINALQSNTIIKFRKRFRSADVLLIDDIQFLAGKERSQEEFFHTFNSIFMNGNSQVVLASDRPPGEIKQLEKRLVTRFESGMTAELISPDEETRCAILRMKAAAMKVCVPEHIVNWLAAKVTSNVRRLEGALVRVTSWMSLHGTDKVSIDSLESLMRDLLSQESRSGMSIDRIQKSVAEGFDIRLVDMVSRKRPAAIALPRQVAMYLSRELTDSSYYEIGEAFGGRDHGTVMHACRAIEKRIKEHESFRHKVAALETSMRRSL